MAINRQTEQYIESLIDEDHEVIRSMEQYAQEYKVPIMEKIGIHFLLQLLTIHQPKKILEIGAAIGYSAIKMANALPNTEIVTIEREEERFSLAKENIEKCSLEDRIHVIFGDALEIVDEIEKFAPFDVLFIDAAKGQYEKFYQLYEPFLTKGGLLIADNVLFKGMVAGELAAPSKRVGQLVKKLQLFNEARMKDPRYKTMIYPIGDGVMVCIKGNE